MKTHEAEKILIGLEDSCFPEGKSLRMTLNAATELFLQMEEVLDAEELLRIMARIQLIPDIDESV